MSEYPEYYLAGKMHRPVKVIRTQEGGLGVYSLNWLTGEFQLDMYYLAELYKAYSDADLVSEEEFSRRVNDIRREIAAERQGRPLEPDSRYRLHYYLLAGRPVQVARWFNGRTVTHGLNMQQGEFEWSDTLLDRVTQPGARAVVEVSEAEFTARIVEIRAQLAAQRSGQGSDETGERST
jgi:hypothetical protein